MWMERQLGRSGSLSPASCVAGRGLTGSLMLTAAAQRSSSVCVHSAGSISSPN